MTAKRGPAPAQGTGPTTPLPAEVTPEFTPVRCEYSGVYCGALGVLERESAGKRGLCCRHYLYGFAAGEAS